MRLDNPDLIRQKTRQQTKDKAADKKTREQTEDKAADIRQGR